ncbi:MAG: sigma-54 dependent transcriptional regulator [Chloroflexi bacterium]|nr:sigma-54 dependent transcriptional regulator [Chloroflexota bacterium]
MKEVSMGKSDRKENILVVDDAPDTLEVVQRNLSGKGYRVFTASDVPSALKLLDTMPVDLVITDLKMPRISGLDLIKHVRENMKDTEVIVITGYPSIEGAVEAVKTGAEEYLTKPFTDSELFIAVQDALDKLHLKRTAGGRMKLPAAPYDIIGDSKPMRKIFDAIEKAASTSATVLITGESGTGKELVARAVHYNSSRAAAPFVPVNCGGIPENLLESELFGHVKGAFTGAVDSRAGFFQTADGGTIFLDEISNTGLSMQAKLLRVLEDKEVCMVGSSRPRKVNVRILAATNKDLMNLVGKGLFREDLFYRLNVIRIGLPPLRDRGDDILLLMRYFTEKFAGELGKPAPKFSDDALRTLKNSYWPGNVRELENLIYNLLIMNDEPVLDMPDLPSGMRFSALRDTGLYRTLEEVETEYIRNVLAGVDGNKTKAAEILGIDRKTLREKMKKIPDAS